MKLRPEVERFALLMEAAMQERDRDWGKNWRGSNMTYFVDRLHQEIDELVIAIHNDPDSLNPDAVKKEAADVANFCMMIAEEIDNPEARR